MISTPGTRFPRAVREPPRRSPAGSPLATLPRRSLVLSIPINLVLIDRTPCFLCFFVCKTRTLISTPGTRFPRAVREPPRRFAPAGSPLAKLFPQESRTFRSNQLELLKFKSLYSINVKVSLYFIIRFIFVASRKFLDLIPGFNCFCTTFTLIFRISKEVTSELIVFKLRCNLFLECGVYLSFFFLIPSIYNITDTFSLRYF
jgi:hypothetical protein